MIYKIKRFSFSERMKGNPKIKDALIHFNQNKIDPELDSDPITKNLPKEMKSWLTFLYENIQVSDEMVGYKNFFIISYENVIKQLEGKNLTWFRKEKYPRVILGWLNIGGNSSEMDIISYIPSVKKLYITREASRIDLLGRGVNRLFNTIFKTGQPTILEVSSLFKTMIANV
jgi:hypothetical protein